MSYTRIFNTGDYVRYTGRKLSRELFNKVGEIYSRIAGTDSGVVVEFGDDSYVMNESVLVKYLPSKDPKAPEIQVKRRRRYDDEE